MGAFNKIDLGMIYLEMIKWFSGDHLLGGGTVRTAYSLFLRFQTLGRGQGMGRLNWCSGGAIGGHGGGDPTVSADTAAMEWLGLRQTQRFTRHL
jgi:hypothetical protein